MFCLKKYVCAQSLDQAYALLMEDTSNTILGGLLWMKMGKKQYNIGIDLSGLGLDQIRETQKTIEMGCMTPLRRLETDPLLKKWFGPLFKEAFQYIVGVQFRNCATLGGSIFPRFGFSDVLTSLLLLDAEIELFHAGVVSLEQFLDMPRQKDILVKVIIEKQKRQTRYLSQRNSATDFPTLSLAIGRSEDTWHICFGARPGRAKRAEQTAKLLTGRPDGNQINKACENIIRELSFGTDSRAQQSYRQMLSQVFLKRGIQQICRSAVK